MRSASNSLLLLFLLPSFMDIGICDSRNSEGLHHQFGTAEALNLVN